MINPIDLDANATTRPYPEVVEAMTEYLRYQVGNPSSAHSTGRSVRASVESARDAVLALVNGRRHHLVFTSGGSESVSMVFRWLTDHTPSPHVVSSTAEHSTIEANTLRVEKLGGRTTYVPVDTGGRLVLEQLAIALHDAHVDLVAMPWVNGETGVIQDVEAIVSLCKEKRVPLLLDAAQAIGKLPINLEKNSVDFLAFSAHKFHGPQGIGGLLVHENTSVGGLILGGDQEASMRAGTENVPGIIGFGVAAEIRGRALQETLHSLRTMRDQLERRVFRWNPSLMINGNTVFRIDNTTNIRFPGVDGQAIVAQLDALGIRCSQGSACTSSRPEPSKTLRAMGLTETAAYESVRFTISEFNTSAEIDIATEKICEVGEKLSAMFNATMTEGAA